MTRLTDASYAADDVSPRVSFARRPRVPFTKPRYGTAVRAAAPLSTVLIKRKSEEAVGAGHPGHTLQKLTFALNLTSPPDKCALSKMSLDCETARTCTYETPRERAAELRSGSRGSQRVMGETPRDVARRRVQLLLATPQKSPAERDPVVIEHACGVSEVRFEASRGADGLLGIDVMSNEAQGAWNVVVAILPESNAAQEGFFRLGDVIISVNGQKTAQKGQGVLARLQQLADHPSYCFEVLRAGLSDAWRRAAGDAYKRSGLTPPLCVGEQDTIAGEAVEEAAESHSQPPSKCAWDEIGPTTPRSVIFAQAAAVQRASQLAKE